MRSYASALRHFRVEPATQYANLSSRVVAPSESIAGLLKENGGAPGSLDTLAERIRAEWELLTLKTAAGIEALKSESD